MLPLPEQLEQILRQQIIEHRRLLETLVLHRQAMKALDLPAIDSAAQQQAQVRLRVAQLEQRRQAVAEQIARQLRLEGQPGVADLAVKLPTYTSRLLEARAELREIIRKVQAEAHSATRLAATVLGHLNTAVRLIAGAVRQSGAYTRSGTPSVAGRVGAIEAVG